MPVTVKQKEKEEHIHFWRQYSNLSEKKCECGKILVSAEEFKQREEEWNNYYEIVRATPAYLDFLEMKQMFKGGDRERMAEVRKQVEERGHFGENEYGERVWEVDKPSLEKPNHPDPIGQAWRYVVGGN